MSASPRPTAGKPSVWAFDGYLMAERETTALNAVKALQTPENKGWRVFDGYLMESSFASCRSPHMSLDKMTPTQPSFVKSTTLQTWSKRREPLNYKEFHFDTNGANQVPRVHWIGPLPKHEHPHLHRRPA